MKTLELENKFSKKGFRHVLVSRRGAVAIYRRFQILNFRKIEHFEVVVVRIAPAVELFGQMIPEREVYPASETWGSLGFTCLDLESAYERAHMLRSKSKD